MSKPTRSAVAAVPTRRHLLLLAAGVAAGAGPLVLAKASCAQAPGGEGKFTKEFAGYVASGGRDRCDQCTRYVAGNGQDNGTCQLVEGTVSRDGWCKFYDD